MDLASETPQDLGRQVPAVFRPFGFRARLSDLGKLALPSSGKKRENAGTTFEFTVSPPKALESRYLPDSSQADAHDEMAADRMLVPPGASGSESLPHLVIPRERAGQLD
jgi:hypothetical protein